MAKKIAVSAALGLVALPIFLFAQAGTFAPRVDYGTANRPYSVFASDL